ncbi:MULTISPECIES: adenine phosphoribosyltransferase [Spiroplasma]|uniref:Adenine phosphoribosyltransferase n=2 Tax=Spiroplasma melliferum TaxID=2134 RepID=A0AAI9X1N4_SPIME|nr:MULTISPECIES: adenine phosphoribosyltransferase [Spiroplasma]ELL44614.1 adenine phosphoribosyltransferase [Spiroplasma melliferum IPMB4A]KAI93070.1 adenine phosphoribosyltransferase [Spiroplasma melliferum KC3]PQP79040.1 adenine phosphoribosyltransferase [Spiroplasma sp. ChiS]QCO24010.1 putative adenine phosphoribosyltransferase [Spiroplasma melliferum]
MDLKKFIVDIPNYPERGVIFRDITPLLNNALAFTTVINQLAAYAVAQKATVIIAPEARGFLFGPAVSYATNLRFIPVRKVGKLPRPVINVKYSYEYAENQLEIHAGDLQPSDRVLIVDDVLASGGTARAMCQLVNQEQATVAGLAFVIDLTYLNGKKDLDSYPIKTLIEY